MPLLGTKEKAELERLILEAFDAYWAEHGSSGLLDPGVSVLLDTTGPSIVPFAPTNALAAVEIRTLFTALCHLSADGPGSMPKDSLASLATEATSSLATQVNRLVSD
jgi:hypothetical protein